MLIYSLFELSSENFVIEIRDHFELKKFGFLEINMLIFFTGMCDLDDYASLWEG